MEYTHGEEKKKHLVSFFFLPFYTHRFVCVRYKPTVKNSGEEVK